MKFCSFTLGRVTQLFKITIYTGWCMEEIKKLNLSWFINSSRDIVYILVICMYVWKENPLTLSWFSSRLIQSKKWQEKEHGESERWESVLIVNYFGWVDIYLDMIIQSFKSTRSSLTWFSLSPGPSFVIPPWFTLTLSDQKRPL